MKALTSKQRSQGLQDSADAIRRRPLFLQDIEANVPMLVDVRMETRRLEGDQRRLVWIRLWEHQLKLIRQPLVLGDGRIR